MRNQRNFFHDFSDSLTIPLLNRLPRLHSLQYKKIDVDTMTNAAIGDINIACNRARNEQDDTRSMCNQAFSEFLFDKVDVAAAALLRTPTSMVEQERHGQGQY